MGLVSGNGAPKEGTFTRLSNPCRCTYEKEEAQESKRHRNKAEKYINN